MSDAPTERHAHVSERLRSDLIVWFISTRPDGRPHTVPVWFLREGDTYLVFTRPGSQKVRNLRQNPNVVLALDDTKGGRDVIIIEGTATLLDEGSVPTTLPAYVEKYGDAIANLGWTPENMATTHGYSQPIRVTPTRNLGW
jgi:PPOX class probable F420-dependent enzyme